MDISTYNPNFDFGAVYTNTHLLVLFTHLWHFSESKLNLKSDGVNLVAPASPIHAPLTL